MLSVLFSEAETTSWETAFNEGTNERERQEDALGNKQCKRGASTNRVRKLKINKRTKRV
jgi:hypothetical protein